MKKITVLALVVVLMVALSVPAFAYQTIPSSVSWWVAYDNEVHLHVPSTSTELAARKTFLNDWLSSPARLLMYHPANNTYGFYILKDDFKSQGYFLANSTKNNILQIRPYYKTDGWSLDGDPRYRFLAITASGAWTGNPDSWSRGTLEGYAIVGTAFANGYSDVLSSWQKGSPVYSGDDIFVKLPDNFAICDDGGVFGTHEEPTTDPGSGSSSEPNSGGGEVVIPPADGVYVTYDTSVWSRIFLPYMKLSMGSSTDVGLSILAIIMGILVVIMIVRQFSKA